jgi:hypothetical protein
MQTARRNLRGLLVRRCTRPTVDLPQPLPPSAPRLMLRRGGYGPTRVFVDAQVLRWSRLQSCSQSKILFFSNTRENITTRRQTCSRSTQAPRTTATANSFFRSSTASTRHSSGVRFPTRRLPALRTSSPLGPIPSQRRLTQQLSRHWPQFKALRQHYAGTHFEEQCSSISSRSTRPRSRNPLLSLR